MRKQFASLLPWLSCIALGLVPFLVTSRYVMRIIDLAGIYMIVAVGLNVLAGYTGQISIGHSGFFALGAYVVGLLNLRLGLPVLLAIPLGGIVAALFGVLLGIPVFRLKGPYLVMATVGFGEIVRIVLVEWSDLTRGAAGLINIGRPQLGPIRIVRETAFFYFIYGFLALILLLTYRLTTSKVGRGWMAIREQELAAEVMGVPTYVYKTSAFAVSALWTGLAGGIFACFQTYISPDSFTFDDSVSFVSMIVVGGIGHLWGGILGAGLLTAAGELLRMFRDYRLIIYGAILIVSTKACPKGLAPLLERIWRRIRGGKAQPCPTSYSE